MGEQRARRIRTCADCQVLPSLWSQSSLFSSFARSFVFVLFLQVCSPISASAQLGMSGGWTIQIIGMVQVEPGPNVLTFKVKDEEIRFAIHDIASRDRSFSTAQFFADVRDRTPNLDVKGADEFLDLLLKEKPSKRVLKLHGSYYLDAHAFMLDAVTPFQEKREEQL